MPRTSIFISHITENASIAMALKAFIEETLLEGAKVFVSPDALSGGDDWQQRIISELKTADFVLVVCTNASVSRPWINFEAGGALVRGATVIPVCWHGCTKASLLPPLAHLHARDLGDDADVRALVKQIADHAELRPKRINVDRLKKLLPKRVTETYDITAGMLLGLDAPPPPDLRLADEYEVNRRPTFLKLQREFHIDIDKAGIGTFTIRETVLHLNPLLEAKIFLHCQTGQPFEDLKFHADGATFTRWERVNDTVVAIYVKPDSRVRVLAPYTYAYSWSPPMVWGSSDSDVISVPIDVPTGSQDVTVRSRIPIKRVIAFKDDRIRKGPTADREIADAALLITDYGCPSAVLKSSDEFTWSIEEPHVQSVYRLVIYYLDDRTPASVSAKSSVAALDDARLTDMLVQLRATALSLKSASRHEIATEMLNLYPEDLKEPFWRKIRSVADDLGIKDLNRDLRFAGAPPGLPLPPEGNLVQYGENLVRAASSLSDHERNIWRLALAVYPPRKHEALDAELKNAARILAKFWENAMAFAFEYSHESIVADLGKLRPQYDSQVSLLAWLEVPLRLQTGDGGPGKVWLFRLARWFDNKNLANHIGDQPA
jgi:hypothetical protein